jgi:Spo0E like sporulation regulatory protein
MVSVYTENRNKTRTDVPICGMQKGQIKEGCPLRQSKRTMEEKMEALRKKMEEAALLWGLGHPKVYQLSRELDWLHNQWEREWGKKRQENDKIYHLQSLILHVKETEPCRMVRVI